MFSNVNNIMIKKIYGTVGKKKGQINELKPAETVKPSHPKQPSHTWIMSSGVLRFRPLMRERRALLSLNLEFPDARRCQNRTTREDAHDLRRLFTRFPSILLHSVFFPSAALLFLFFYSLSSSPLCYMFSTSFLLFYLCRGSRDMSPMVTRAEVVSWPH